MNKTEKIALTCLAGPLFCFMITDLLSSRDPSSPLSFGYPVGYCIRAVLALLVCAFCARFWVKMFPPRWTRWTTCALFLGVVSTSLWVLLAAIPVKNPFLMGDARPAFNPFNPKEGIESWAWAFWSVRMFGLVVLVPVMEEIFLRGWFLRWVQGGNWLERSVGEMTALAWGALAFYAVVTHPEWIAAVVWFALVTFYVQRTKNLWDAVLFHVGTNTALGIYVLFSGQWGLM